MRGASVLDIACAEGYFLHGLKQRRAGPLPHLPFARLIGHGSPEVAQGRIGSIEAGGRPRLERAPGTELEVGILGERCRALVGREPLYDPDNQRLRA